MLPYALSIFVGAFLLFQVQPLIAKYILPWFGGSPGVWTTCMLFFQMLLLGGYAYAHFSTTKLKPRQQAVLHLVLLGVALLLVGFMFPPSEAWKSRISGEPTIAILLLLSVCIGLPYFVLSSTGPLMQQWFTQTHPGTSPYRLYALSNIGSLLALLSYPIVIERYVSRHSQATLWSIGLVLFVGACGFCAWRLRRLAATGGSVSPSISESEAPIITDAQTLGLTDPQLAPEAPAAPEAPVSLDRFLWLALPGAASMLLLATTNKVTQEVAVIPFLWVLPLSIYLLTFIICFDHTRWYVRGPYIALLVAGIGASSYALYQGNSMPFMHQIAVFCSTLFLGCMVCHGELYKLKPPTSQLTAFYLMISAGGAIGGLIVAVGAPLFFKGIWELQISLWVLSYLLGVICFRLESLTVAWGVGAGGILATFLVPYVRSLRRASDGLWSELTTFYPDNWKVIAASAAIFLFCVVFNAWRRRLRREWAPASGIFVMCSSVVVGIILVIQIRGEDDKGPDSDSRLASVSRNFYGTIKVWEYNIKDPDSAAHYFLLLNGATTHGMQFTQSPQSGWPTTYYGESSGVGLAIQNFTRPGPHHWGVVGLGTGSLSAYGKEGDTVTLYDINERVRELAETQFTYLEQARKRQVKVDVVMGDARLSMERQLADPAFPKFDVLALDAFSSDAIPVHLLTKESMEIYVKLLAPDGVIAIHTSNRNLDLRPVVENAAAAVGMTAATISDDAEKNWWLYRTTWILVTKNKELLEIEAIKKVIEPPVENPRQVDLWTDDYTSLWGILK